MAKKKFSTKVTNHLIDRYSKIAEIQLFAQQLIGKFDAGKLSFIILIFR